MRINIVIPLRINGFAQGIFAADVSLQMNDYIDTSGCWLLVEIVDKKKSPK